VTRPGPPGAPSLSTEDPSPTDPPPPIPLSESEPRFRGRIALKGRSLRAVTARGTLINGAYQVFLITLGMLRGVVVAAFLSASEYGVWGIIFITVITLTWLKQVGVGDKFVQQGEEDQEAAFQKAFTFELLVTAAFLALFAVSLPLVAWLYGAPEIILPGAVMGLALLIAAFQSPLWVFLRRMDFVRVRLIQALDPVVGFVVTVALAIAGAGYWSLVAGVLAGASAGAIGAIVWSPYKLRLRYAPGTVREYFSFSWPLIVAGGSSLMIAQGSVLATDSKYGIAGVGAIALASTVAAYSDRVDGVVTETVYPAICAVRERTDLLFETFVKSNRLSLIWGIPFGVGISLFAGDIVHFLLSGKGWGSAEILLRTFGLTAAAGHIGFNWDAFYRARGETRPIAIWSALTMLSFVAMPLPLLLLNGFGGFAIGMGVMTAVSLAVRGYYLARLFSGFKFARHAARAMLPTVPAVAAVLAMRALEGMDRSIVVALAEVFAYGIVTVVATVLIERELITEVVGYLRNRAAAGEAPARA